MFARRGRCRVSAGLRGEPEEARHGSGSLPCGKLPALRGKLAVAAEQVNVRGGGGEGARPWDQASEAAGGPDVGASSVVKDSLSTWFM